MFHLIQAWLLPLQSTYHYGGRSPEERDMHVLLCYWLPCITNFRFGIVIIIIIIYVWVQQATAYLSTGSARFSTFMERIYLLRTVMINTL